MIFSKPKTVADAIAGLTKAVTDLDSVCAAQAEAAADKRTEAHKLNREADDALSESERAQKVASKLREITEA